jgi:hypothetical protein
MEAGERNIFDMLKILGGPKLLPVRMSKLSHLQQWCLWRPCWLMDELLTGRNPNEKSEAEEEQAKSESNVQSFRSDRRLVRLVRACIPLLLPDPRLILLLYGP